MIDGCGSMVWQTACAAWCARLVAGALLREFEWTYKTCHTLVPNELKNAEFIAVQLQRKTIIHDAKHTGLQYHHFAWELLFKEPNQSNSEFRGNGQIYLTLLFWPDLCYDLMQMLYQQKPCDADINFVNCHVTKFTATSRGTTRDGTAILWFLLGRTSSIVLLVLVTLCMKKVGQFNTVGYEMLSVPFW